MRKLVMVVLIVFSASVFAPRPAAAFWDLLIAIVTIAPTAVAAAIHKAKQKKAEEQRKVKEGLKPGASGVMDTPLLPRPSPTEERSPES